MTEETQTTEGKSGSRGWMGGVAAVALVVILAILFLLPGFVAARFSRANVAIVDIDTVVQRGKYQVIYPWLALPAEDAGVSDRAKAQVAEWYLIPANCLITRSRMAGQFYKWEFRVAGGREGLIGNAAGYVEPEPVGVEVVPGK